MKRSLVALLILASVVLGVVGIASAAPGGIDPFTVQSSRR